MKKSKKSDKIAKNKLIKEIDSLLSKRAETLVFEEIKKSIMNNPALMSQLSQAEKSLGKGNAEVE